MTRKETRERAIRQNPKQVRMDDLDSVLCDNNFLRDITKEHVIYQHSVFTDIVFNVAKPHGSGESKVNTRYVKNAIEALDKVKERRGHNNDEEDKG